MSGRICPSRCVLEVEDMRGQLGHSAALEMALPARTFFDPLAKALVEQRPGFAVVR